MPLPPTHTHSLHTVEMAMAFIAETGEEDSLSPYPPAPPPSPEATPQNLLDQFEIPLSKFAGLEAERSRFDSPDLKLSPPSPEPYGLSGGEGGGGTSNFTNNATSPNSLHGAYGNTLFPDRTVQSAVSSSYQFPVSVNSPVHSQSLSPEATLSDFHSPPKRAHSARVQSHSSPQHILGASGQLANGFSDLTLHSSHPHPSPPHSTEQQSMLSRSYDSHLLYPYLEEGGGFEDSLPAEVRPTRAYSLDTYCEDATQRRRKISLKRKNDEIGGDPNLQFTFDYSYSSTSSTESDWVVVDSSASNYPQGKKACWQDAPLVGVSASSTNHLPPVATLSSVVTTTLAGTTVPYCSLQKPRSLDYHPPAVMTSISEMVGGGGTQGSGSNSSLGQLLLPATRRNGTHFHALSSPANIQDGLQANHHHGGVQARLYSQDDLQGVRSAIQDSLQLHSKTTVQDSIHRVQDGLQSMVGRATVQDGLQCMVGRSTVQDGFVAPSLQAHDSLLMMDCGDYGGARLDSLDSMDVCQSEGMVDGAVEMESLGPISLEQHTSSMHEGAVGGSANIGHRSHSSAGSYSNSVLIPPHPSENSPGHCFSSYHHTGGFLFPPGGDNEEDLLQSRFNFSKSL